MVFDGSPKSPVSMCLNGVRVRTHVIVMYVRCLQFSFMVRMVHMVHMVRMVRMVHGSHVVCCLLFVYVCSKPAGTAL
jgi:hypothetical protein